MTLYALPTITFADELFAGGDGSAEDPFQIATCTQLQNIETAGIAADLYNFILTDDIDCSDTTSWNSGNGFIPIGVDEGGFTGYFDGNYKTISGLYANWPDDVSAGLFFILNSGQVVNLFMDDADVLATAYSGVLAGAMFGAIIDNVHVSSSTAEGLGADPSIFPGVGGLVGVVIEDGEEPSIRSSSAEGVVIGSSPTFQFVGGLVGVLSGATVRDSFASTTVTGGISTGGLVGAVINDQMFNGLNIPSLVTDSYARGSVSGDQDGGYVGGLIGTVGADSYISYSFSLAHVSGDGLFLGGVVGGNGFSEFDVADVVDADSLYFDSEATGQTLCVGTEASFTCGAVNTGAEGDNTDDTYFFGNNSNGPLSHFSTSVWTFPSGLLPQLRGMTPPGPPVISHVETVSSNNSFNVVWDTDLPADSKVYWGLIEGVYATSSPTYNSDDPQTSHSIDIMSSIYECTQYHFMVESTSSGGTATSTDGVFTTPCLGDAVVQDQVSEVVEAGGSGTTTVSLLREDGTGISLSIPVSTLEDDDLQLQIKDIGDGTVLNVFGLPAHMSAVGDYLYNAEGYQLSGMLLWSSVFDPPMTLTIRYKTDDVENIDVSSLSVYYTYSGDEWTKLEGCTIDSSAQTISCPVTHFTIFGLFGSPSASPQSHGSSESIHFGCKDPQASNYERFSAHKQNMCEYDNATQSLQSIVHQYRDLLLYVYASGIMLPHNILAMLGIDQATMGHVRDLTYGMTGDDVVRLQTLLIREGYDIPAGATGLFYRQTQSALSMYQADHHISPSVGYFGPMTQAQMKTAGVIGLWW